MSPIILEILETITTKITDDSNVVWTRYDNPAQLRAELASYLEQLRTGDTSCLPKLSLNFAPTGTFQDLAISNGWGDEYLALAEAFDKAYAP